MLKRNLFKRISIITGLSLFLNMAIPVSAGGIFGEYPEGEILSFGCSLTKEQENKLREYFNVSDDVDAIYVTTEVAVKQLGLDEEKSKSYKGGWYSSAYVKLTNGSGMNVKSSNLTLVTDDMLANALITSGILNAEVIATAPFKVTGQSALAGILAGAEKIMGEELSQENKETAQQEIETTLDVAEEIGQKEASAIINEIKAEVIKDSPINITQIEKIVINVTNNYGVELSDNTRAKVVNTMSAINDLDINYKEVKNSLKDVSDKLFKDLKDVVSNGEDIGIKIKDSGIFTKIGDFVKDLVEGVINCIKEWSQSYKETNSNDNINADVNMNNVDSESNDLNPEINELNSDSKEFLDDEKEEDNGNLIEDDLFTSKNNENQTNEPENQDNKDSEIETDHAEDELDLNDADDNLEYN